jgi:hypothetical protein
MKKTILAAAALLLASASAQAEVLDLRITHVPPHWHLDRGPRIVHVPLPTTEADVKERAASIARWEAFCKPVRNVDSLGVTRLTYAHPGCEYGRGEK